MKRITKRFFAVILLCAFLTLLLSGCHGKGGLTEFVIPDELDESRHIEITFWAKNDSNKPQADIYKKAIEDFEALYPNITVNIRQYTDYGKIYNDVITNIATYTTPNVCITYPDHIATYMTGQNIVVPLDELINDSRYGLGGPELKFDAPTVSEMIPQFLKEGVIDGIQYAIPYMRSTEACYVNKDLVEKLGYELPEVLTWDFVWEVSEAAMAKDDEDNFIINGQKVMIPFIYKSTDNMMIQTLMQLGAGYSTPDGEILLFNDTTKDFLYTIAEHAGTGAFSTFKISSYPGNFLNAGQCIFAVDSTAGATWMGSNAPLLDIPEDQLVDFETVV
ncbi:MAG: extracellular solute-binding protein, partial [Oscillospiraceae bacterium]|nr:extracellular solute-binding protein [Oscillospiraceae bacterium]